eukprot:6143074-Pyramimonas_sp.AAC.1
MTRASSRPYANAAQVVSYNPMSVLSCGRLDDICQEFRHKAVIGLQGTGLPGHDLPLERRDVGNHIFISAGYGRRSNKHA